MRVERYLNGSVDELELRRHDGSVSRDGGGVDCVIVGLVARLVFRVLVFLNWSKGKIPNSVADMGWWCGVRHESLVSCEETLGQVLVRCWEEGE